MMTKLTTLPFRKKWKKATSNKCHASSNKCLTSSNKKLLGTSASLVVTGATLVVTMFATSNKCLHNPVGHMTATRSVRGEEFARMNLTCVLERNGTQTPEVKRLFFVHMF